MEIPPTVTHDYNAITTMRIANLAFVILCFRGYFSGFLGDTLAITIILNCVIACAIDYHHVRQSFFVFAILSFLTIYNKDVLALIDILAFIYILRGTKLKKLIQLNAIILSLFLLTWFVLFKVGILHDSLKVMPKGTAHCMGFDNSNQFGMQGFYIIASLFLLVRGKGRIFVFLIIPIINETFFKLAVSRTPWLGGYVIMLVMLFSWVGALRPQMRYIIGILPGLILGLVIYIAKHLVQYPELDVIFSTRFSNAANLLNNLTPLNLIIGFPQQKSIIIDSSYLMILCSGGIMALVLFFGKFYQAIVYRWKIVLPYMPFLIAMLALGIGENAFSSVGALSVIFWYIIFESNDKYELKKLTNHA